MCIKLVYYNTYGDGSRDVTEAINTCSPGAMCPRPEVRETHRKYRFTKDHDKTYGSTERYHHTDYLRMPLTPRHSLSPSPSRMHKTAVYINNEKVSDIPLAAGIKKRHSTHTHTHTDRADRERERVILHAPDPPAPLLPRSATMPSEYLHVERPARRRTREADGSEYTHYHIPAHHHRRHAAAEADFIFINDEHEKRERRRGLRRSNTTQARSSSKAAPTTKNLRWADDYDAQVAAQNERIAARPALHQQLKGILKTPKASKEDDVLRDLRRKMERLDMTDSAKVKPRKTHSPHSPLLGSDSDYDYDADKLRARFGDDRRRRSRVSYGAGLYNYQ